MGLTNVPAGPYHCRVGGDGARGQHSGMALLHPSSLAQANGGGDAATAGPESEDAAACYEAGAGARSDRWPAPLQLIDREWFDRHAASEAARLVSATRD
jgi:hypothetical protein